MTQINPYNPLDLHTLGDSLIRAMEERALETLGGIASFPGSGVHFLYYVGKQLPYKEMGEFNARHNCPLPIYVGRAKDPGARQGHSPFEPVTAFLLFERILEHRRSVATTGPNPGAQYPISVDDFRVRALVSMPIWVPLAEAMAVRRYQPLWNAKLQGFGIHAPGGGRDKQRRSE